MDMEEEAGVDRDPSTSSSQPQSQAVKVAVHIRPLIAQERIQGCKECVGVVPGEPQIQLGAHSFTFDHVYGAGGSAPSAIFDECVRSLVDGLFHGYNATVLAYGQTGSGKTYTMGTAYSVGGNTHGVIPQVMDTIYKTIETRKDKADFQIRVSFIEILKEEVHDLLDPNPPSTVLKAENATGGATKNPQPGKPPVQIRETGTGGIILAGVTETEVRSLVEMAACLEAGSLCRATGSTNMNSQSSRSHAIFTINVEQRRKWDIYLNGDVPMPEDAGEDFLCAKLHLVDLAGSERAKRTKADGNRFKEGVHINRGLLALGNVISALGDDKKRKEGGHVPYRDSKLTRLLQDSLGGNSRTVMIACVSPADSNAEETLNTLKYANRARNIQNKPIVNRDPMAAEMQKMRQQLEILQAELLCARAASVPEEMEILKQKVAWLEASNIDLRHELHRSSVGCAALSQQVIDAQVERDRLLCKLQKLRNGEKVEEDDGKSDDLLKGYHTKIQELEMELQRYKVFKPQLSTIEQHSDHPLEDANGVNMNLLPGDDNVEREEVAVKELEHTMLQDCLDKELQELNKRLELKEAEMKSFARPDNFVLKQHFEKKLLELEDEKKHLQKERDELLKELEKLATSSDDHAHKMQEAYVQKLKDLEHQIAELRKKQENQAQLLRQKQRSDEAAKRLQEDIMRIKQQKVQLQNKIKQESEQFRAWKSEREKEVLQLRKEGRRNEYEMHKLQALHQRQKLVLQRKTEEAAAATRRLKELLEARKVSPRENLHSQSNERALQQWLDQELEVAVRVHEVRAAYEKQTEERTAMAKELAKLNEEEQAFSTPSAFQRMPVSMSPSARRARIGLIETMINASSTSLVAMASQLSEAEERERAFTGRARWQSLRTIGDLKSMLNLSFNTAAFARCQLRDKEIENKELQEKLNDLSQALKQSEAHRLDIEEKQRLKENAVAVALATASKDGAGAAVQRGMEELSNGLLRLTGKKLQYGRGGGEVGLPYDLRKVSRPSTVYNDVVDVDSDSSEWDAEMELEAEVSDEEWDIEDEKHAPRVRKTSTGDCEQKPKPKVEVCCSCSQTSGCKTKKCECKHAGGLCGINCTCKATKCANREFPDGAETGSLAEAVAGPSGDNAETTSRADELLAKHGAKLLDRAFKDEITSEESGGATVVKLRRPLSDIGNTKVTISVQKPAKQKRRSRAPQLVHDPEAQAPPPPAAQQEQPEAAPALPVEAAAAAAAAAPAHVEPSNEQQRRHVPARPPPVPHQQHQQAQAQVQALQGSASASSSPLRARNRHRSGSREDVLKRPARSKSPCKKPGEEKENLR